MVVLLLIPKFGNNVPEMAISLLRRLPARRWARKHHKFGKNGVSFLGSLCPRRPRPRWAHVLSFVLALGLFYLLPYPVLTPALLQFPPAAPPRPPRTH